MALTRRQIGYGAVAVAAAGAGLWWGQSGRRDNPGLTGSQAPPPGFWDRSFRTTTGASLGLRAFAGRPLVINFWATWCPPCVREMPELDRFARQFGGRGWQVLGLAIDQSEAVQSFLQRTPVSFPIALGGNDGLGIIRELGNTSGGLPFTVVISAQGKVTSRKMGATDFDELSAWASA
jgi:thiol-disulfide isomerase/thioredoxin